MNTRTTSSATPKFCYFSLEVDANGVALLKLNGAGKVNLLSTTVMSDLEGVLDHLATRMDVTGLVIYSDREHFIVGADIKDIARAQQLDKNVAVVASRDGKALFDRIAKLPYKSVAVIHGRCLGGGTELALACTYRIASDDETTMLGLPEVALGVIPGWGGTIKAGKLLGLANGLRLVLSPLKPWNAHKAWRLGLVDEVLPRCHMLNRAAYLVRRAHPSRYKPSFLERFQRWLVDREPARSLFGYLAKRKIAKETQGKYPACFAALDVMLASFRLDAETAAGLESSTFARLCHTPQSKDAVQKFLTR